MRVIQRHIYTQTEARQRSLKAPFHPARGRALGMVEGSVAAASHTAPGAQRAGCVARLHTRPVSAELRPVGTCQVPCRRPPAARGTRPWLDKRERTGLPNSLPGGLIVSAHLLPARTWRHGCDTVSPWHIWCKMIREREVYGTLKRCT